MRQFSFLLGNYLLFAFLGFLLTGLQASLWLNLFGYFPSPYLWIPIVCYWTINRSPIEAILMTYLLSFVVFAMSGAPLKMIFALNIFVFAVTFLMKDRVLWSGPISFMLASGLTAFLLPIASYVLSHTIEFVPQNDFQIWDWLSRPLLTALFAMPLYYVFSLVDRLTQKNAPRNMESEIL